MTDRELLEMAAKAAGVVGQFANDGKDAPIFFDNPKTPGIWGSWNPLTDDGDAFRLACRLKLDILWAEHEKSVIACNDSSNDDTVTEKVRFTTDPYAATRRAIVRAASEIGMAT